MTSVTQKKRHPKDAMMYAAIYFCAALSVFLLLGIIFYVLVKGIGQVNWQFLTGVTSILKGTVGIAGNILNTLYIIVLTMLIATPVGVGAAVYLNEYAKPGKLVSLIEFATETLSGIPSIIFGLFGMMFFGETIGLSYSILTGTFTLVLMVLPLITRNTQEALKTVPQSYRSGAIGLGTGKWYDSNHSSAVCYAGNYYRCNSGNRTNCWRVSSTFIYSGKFRTSSGRRT